jgi:mannitol-1-phosphate 5-dehydrogenase
VEHIADLRALPGIMAFLRAAFIEESGEALVRKRAGVDPLFTPPGYAAYADDLLERMTNPHLRDSVERVGRDPARKLGWDDRLMGTMRVALQQGVEPRRYAWGAAAALAILEPAMLHECAPATPLLDPLWREASPDAAEKEVVLHLIESACQGLREWRAAEFSDLERFFQFEFRQN